MAIHPNGLGQIEGTADRKALMLKVFSGEVLKAFERNNIMMDKNIVKTIKHGKSAQFPVLGMYSENDIQNFSPGDTVSTGSINHNERVINLEGLKIASVFVDEYEEKMNHYETRSYYSNQLGQALARKIDKRILTELVTGTTAKGVADQPDGFQVKNTAIASSTTKEGKGNVFIDSIYSAVEEMNSNDVTGDKYVVTTPGNYNNLVLSNKGVHSDYTQGNGGIDTGKIFKIAGISILWSNNLPVQAGLEGLVFTKDAVGTLKFMDIATESEYLIERQGNLVLAKYATGHGLLNPGCVGAITSA